MVASVSVATMVEYKWLRKKVFARSLHWNAQIARNGTIRLKKTVAMIRVGWS